MHKHLLIPLVLSLGMSSAMADGSASGNCSALTTRGSWVYTCEGSLPAPMQTPTRILGRCTASKSGLFTCAGTVNLGGQILSQGLQGQSATLPNCTGTVSYAQSLNGGYAGQLDISYVVSQSGDAIDGLPTNSGGVLSCRLRRIDKAGD